MIYARLESSRENRNTSVCLWDEEFSVPGTLLQKKVSVPFILREEAERGFGCWLGFGSRTQEALVRVSETGKGESHCQVIITRVPCGQWGLVPLGLPEKHNAFRNCPLER